MNASGSSSYGSDSGMSGQMKAFFLLVILFLVFLMFASSSLANVDLTNNGPATAVQGVSVVEPAQVLTIHDDTPITNTGSQPLVAPTLSASLAQGQAVVPVTGGCTDPYTVQPGDMLSQIAADCNTTVATIRLANPQITNANLIYPGQQLRITASGSAGSGAVQATAIPVTGLDDKNSSTLVIPTAVVQPTTAVVQPQVLPATGADGRPVIRAGTRLAVRGIHYPPNTPVNIAVGPQTTGYSILAVGITDSSGAVNASITLPAATDTAAPWVVVVATASNPTVQAMSQPFYISP